MLRRIGNKMRLLPKLLPLFPEQITTFVDLFMGSGAVTFAMVDRATAARSTMYVFANDKDEEIFNLFMAVKEHRAELIEAIEIMPIHAALFEYWKTQREQDCVWRAARFLMRSNFGLYGHPDTLHFTPSHSKQRLLENLMRSTLFSPVITYLCHDFRQVLASISFHDDDTRSAFVYADPPYLDTSNNYQDGFTAQDAEELFALLVNSGIRFAISEFDQPIIVGLAEKYALHVTELGERKNLKNRRTEILITNYEPIPQQFSFLNGCRRFNVDRDDIQARR